MAECYVPGDFWRVCDVCGFEYRASQTFKRWDGLITCQTDWEPRHPQDMVRGKSDRQRVFEPRPEANDTYVATQTVTTADANAGATSLSVSSSSGMIAGHRVGIQLDSGLIHDAVLQAVPGATSLTLTAATALPGPAASGAVVIDYSTITEPSL